MGAEADRSVAEIAWRIVASRLFVSSWVSIRTSIANTNTRTAPLEARVNTEEPPRAQPRPLKSHTPNNTLLSDRTHPGPFFRDLHSRRKSRVRRPPPRESPELPSPQTVRTTCDRALSSLHCWQRVHAPRRLHPAPTYLPALPSSHPPGRTCEVACASLSQVARQVPFRYVTRRVLQALYPRGLPRLRPTHN